MATLMLIDGNSLTYRAFHALPPDLATASGQVTNAVFGFTSMLINLVRDHRPDGIVVAFDLPEPTFRHDRSRHLQGQPREGPRRACESRWVWSARCSRCCACRSTRADRIRGRRHHRHVGHPGRGRGHDVLIVTGDRDSYPAGSGPTHQGRLQQARRRRTTRSTTRRASSSAPASGRATTWPTLHSVVIRPTTSPASPGSARRRQPS